MDYTKLQADMRAKQASLQALLAKENLNTEELTAAETLAGECEALQNSILEAQAASTRLANLAVRAGAVQTRSEQLAPGLPGMGGGTGGQPALDAARQQLAPQGGGNLFAIPATASRPRVKNFKSRDGLSGEERAHGFGQWLLASRGVRKAQQWCHDRGIQLMQVNEAGIVTQLGQVENINTQGGVLVPPMWDNDLIDLREQYGLVRQLFKNRTMTSDVLNVPRRTGGLTAYFATDSVAGTESTKNWDLVNLTAKKLIVLAKTSSELAEDAIINIADDLAGEIAYAFAEKEDRCGFIGDGTSTYGGITGVTTALLNLSATRANIAGLWVGADNVWSGLLLSDFNQTKAKLPAYAAQSPNTVWVVSQAFWSSVMERLMLAVGGITDAMIAAGVQPRMLGYPVKISQAMPLVEANDQVCALLGDFGKAASFGDRRQTTIMLSEHYSFNTDSVDIRGTERFDINVSDVGNQSATAADRVAGPVVGLLTAAS